MHDKKWSRETIYKEEFQSSGDMVMAEDVEDYPWKFQPEFLAACKAEEKWIGDPARVIPSESFEAIGLGQKQCPVCRGSARYLYRKRGETTGIELTYQLTCSCLILKTYYREIAKIPKKFRHVRLDTLAPSPLSRMSLTKQAELIELLKENPEGSYLFWGDSQAGKTHMTTALYQHRLWSWASASLQLRDCPIWRVNTGVLLDQWVRRSTDEEAPLPDVREFQIRNRAREGEKPCLILDELERFKPSEFKLNKLFELVNTIYEVEGQVIATCNASPEELTAAWGTTYGDTILRRIGQSPDGITVHFRAE